MDQYSTGDFKKKVDHFSIGVDTKQNAQVFKVVLPEKIVEIITQDPAIKIKDKQILEIDTKGALGKTFSLTVKLATK